MQFLQGTLNAHQTESYEAKLFSRYRACRKLRHLSVPRGSAEQHLALVHVLRRGAQIPTLLLPMGNETFSDPSLNSHSVLSFSTSRLDASRAKSRPNRPNDKTDSFFI